MRMAECKAKCEYEGQPSHGDNSTLGKNSRLYLLGAMLLFWCVAICGRLVYLQIFSYGKFVKQADTSSSARFRWPPSAE